MKIGSQCTNDSKGTYTIRLDLEEDEIAIFSGGKVYRENDFPIFGQMAIDVISELEQINYTGLSLIITL